MRFATDTGGTFTDLIVEDDNGELRAFKSATVSDDPVAGIVNVLALAAEDFEMSLSDFLAQGSSFIHGTTHALNAVITGNTARTAFITTKGHRDILLMREGGRSGAFDHNIPYPAPYIPRELSFEVSERIDAAGDVVTIFDEASAIKVIEDIATRKIEAVAVCFLWSIRNPAHEIRLGELLRLHLPDVPVTLSHQLNPVIREFRRASSASIDASLKPLMTSYLGGLEARLQESGFSGRMLVLTSKGGMQDVETVTAAPIQVLNSGPSMAPLAGKHYAEQSGAGEECKDVIVTDTGGTTYDVSLVRDGRIPLTHDMWIGAPFQGHLTGFPSVDVTSVGAGGGSIAFVDSGGILHVGPQSAGSEPGPACYGRGGVLPTVTDAAVVLGYLDPGNFLGGRMVLDGSAAEKAIDVHVSQPLACGLEEAAAAILDIATENMVQAILDITMNQGVDPSCATLIGGGGAAGLNSVFIARRLGCPELIFPEVGAMLSATGAIISDLVAEFRNPQFFSSEDFDVSGANIVLADLEGQCSEFIDKNQDGLVSTSLEYGVEARYMNQAWAIDVLLRSSRFDTKFDIDDFAHDFHIQHERLFAMRDESSPIEIVGWSATARCAVRSQALGRLKRDPLAVKEAVSDTHTRRVYFVGSGKVEAAVYTFDSLTVDTVYDGPAIIESPFTTIVADPLSTFRRSASGSLIMSPTQSPKMSN